jgi:hypothetical protein
MKMGSGGVGLGVYAVLSVADGGSASYGSTNCSRPTLWLVTKTGKKKYQALKGCFFIVRAPVRFTVKLSDLSTDNIINMWYINFRLLHLCYCSFPPPSPHPHPHPPLPPHPRCRHHHRHQQPFLSLRKCKASLLL